MQYSKGVDLGFDKDAVVMIPLASEAKDSKTHTLRNQLFQIAGVENVSLCFGAPSSTNSWGIDVKY